MATPTPDSEVSKTLNRLEETVQDGSKQLAAAIALRDACLNRLEKAIRDGSERGDPLASKINAATPEEIVENLVAYFEAAAPAIMPDRAPNSSYDSQTSADKPTDYLAAIYGNPGTQDNDNGHD